MSKIRNWVIWPAALLCFAFCIQAQEAGAQSTTSQSQQAPTSQSSQTAPATQAAPAPFYRPPSASAASKAGSPKAPDMVCFGYYPSWSVQFRNGQARYLGMNEPDKAFKGGFYWVPDEKTWEWHRQDSDSGSGVYGLSASIQQMACVDPVRKTKYPYSAQVYLPQGDMVSGCCRKLLPSEAPVGKSGVPASQAAPQQNASSASSTSSTNSTGAQPAHSRRSSQPQAGIPQTVQPPQ